MAKDSLSFGRTGPLVPVSCGCDVLPWEPCRHSGQTALKAPIRETKGHVPPEPRTRAVAPAASLGGASLWRLLMDCREMAHWYTDGRGYRGQLSRRVLHEIERELRSLPHAAG